MVSRHTRDQLVHSNIADSPELPGELRAALIGHYVIGIVLAVVNVAGASWLGLSPGALPVAIGYGLAACLFPWFLVYPALSFGAFGLKGPQEMKPIISSVLNHLFYSLGQWWSAMLLWPG